MKGFDEASFHQLYLDKYEKLKNDFLNAFNKSRIKILCKKNWENDINSRMSNLAKENFSQTQIFEQAATIYHDDENLSFADAIKIYCAEINKDAIPDSEFLSLQLAQNKVRSFIWAMSLDVPIQNAIDDKLTAVKKNKLTSKKSTKTNANTHLSDIIVNKESYDYLIKTLVDEGFYDNENGIWLRSGKGAKQKLCALLILLVAKGYYHRKKIPTYKVMSEIAKNTFKVKVSERSFHFPTVNQHKKDYEFIKKASDLS
jgi:hypothetical protein